MKLRRKEYRIESAFIIILFALFFTAVIAALLLTISFYRKVVALGEENEVARGATAYIREIIHQNDTEGSISISEFHGLPCIRVEQEEGYLMYLYVEGGNLRQLYLKESAQVDIKDGQSIMKLDALILEEMGPGLFRVICIDRYGQQAETMIAMKSQGEQ